MLKPIPRPQRRRRRFLTYDLEWLPGSLKLRMIGVYDGIKYRCYTEEAENLVRLFFSKELTSKNSGKWFYAHAGGLADIQFILEELAKDPAYSVEGSFSGSSAIIVKVSRSNCRWYFIDSYWTLRGSLAKIGEKIGMPKGEVAWDAPLDKLIPYNKQDCVILWTALDQFQDILVNLGSELRMTLASSSMRLFRRKYLNREITTSSKLNQLVRPAYVGGRVEVFYRKIHSGFYYDINSCYPFAMTKPLPGQYIKMSPKLPEDKKYLYIAHIKIEVPEMSIPPLPYLTDKHLFFPTGIFEGWYCQPEIELALKLGCKIHKVYQCLYFKPFLDLRYFAMELYEKRKASLGFMNETFKILLNAGYGKFGERPEKQSLLINPTPSKMIEIEQIINEVKQIRAKEQSLTEEEIEALSKEPKRYLKNEVGLISPGIWLLKKEKHVQHAHVPVAAFVTSYARVNLMEHLLTCPNVYYCDTDGFATDADRLYTGKKLGEIKLEKTYVDSLFHSPKLYHLQLASGEHIVKAKGFPKLDPEGFLDLIMGEKIGTPFNMLRIRELYSKGFLAPREEEKVKGLSFKNRPKRFFYPNGTSRAWDIKELEQTYIPQGGQEWLYP